MKMEKHAWKRLNILLLAVLFAAGLMATSPGLRLGAMAQAGDKPPAYAARDAGSFPPQVPVAWFDLAYDLVRDEGLSPPLAARIFAYLGVGLYEALVPGMPDYQSLAGQLNGLPPLPPPADHAYHWPAVANSALAATMHHFLTDGASAAQIAALESQYAGEFRAALPPGVWQRSLARGQAIGAAIRLWAESDGIENNASCGYSLPEGDGVWASTPPGYRPPLLPCWGEMRTFVLAGGSDCAVGPPPAYSEESGSPFYQEAWEVYETVNHVTAEQLAIARYWADDPGVTGTPPGHSISILSQVLAQQDESLATAAEAYARLGIALADSFIACWWTKYDHNLLRPVTYVHMVIGDTAWMPPVNTPPFPEYTSGHSVQSAAAAQVLTDMFGDVPFTDHTHDALGYAPRSFPDFFAFAEEAAISRLYGGIHYRAAIEIGLEQGICIGRRVSSVRFRSSQLTTVAQ
jgi:hypothetical protein